MKSYEKKFVNWKKHWYFVASYAIIHKTYEHCSFCTFIEGGLEMKLYKRAMGWICVAAMAVSMAACSGNGEATAENITAPAETEPVIQTILDESNTKMQQLSSVESTTEYDVFMTVETERIMVAQTEDTVFFADPLKMDIEIFRNAGNLIGEKNMDLVNLRIARQDDKIMLHQYQNGGLWSKNEISEEELEGYNIKNGFSFFLEYAAGMKEVGQETVNDVQTTKYEGILDREAMEEPLQVTFPADLWKQIASDTDMELSELVQNASDMKLTLWINEEGYVVKYELDMTDALYDIFIAWLQGVGATKKQAEENIGVSNARITISNQSFNNAPDFQIPQ